MGAVQACKCNCNKKTVNDDVQVDVEEPLIGSSVRNNVVYKSKIFAKLHDSSFHGDMTPPESSRRNDTNKDNSADMLVEIKEDKYILFY
jgi:hypothetical protein